MSWLNRILGFDTKVNHIGRIIKLDMNIQNIKKQTKLKTFHLKIDILSKAYHSPYKTYNVIKTILTMKSIVTRHDVLLF